MRTNTKRFVLLVPLLYVIGSRWTREGISFKTGDEEIKFAKKILENVLNYTKLRIRGFVQGR